MKRFLSGIPEGWPDSVITRPPLADRLRWRFDWLLFRLGELRDRFDAWTYRNILEPFESIGCLPEEQEPVDPKVFQPLIDALKSGPEHQPLPEGPLEIESLQVVLKHVVFITPDIAMEYARRAWALRNKWRRRPWRWLPNAKTRRKLCFEAAEKWNDRAEQLMNLNRWR